MGPPLRSFDFMVEECFGTIEALYDMMDDVLKPLVEVDERFPDEIMPRLPFTFTANSIQRIKIAHRCVKYYILIRRSVTPNNLTWEVFVNHR